MGTSTPVRDKLETMLRDTLSPMHLEIQDDSHKHAGHAGSRPQGETHFRVTVVSMAFAGESRVNRQRRVYAVLKPLLDEHVHALQLFTYTPEEYSSNLHNV